MWYVTDKNQHMDPRCFGDLTLLLKTILIDSTYLVSRYITERSFKDDTFIRLPFDCGIHSIGQLTTAWAKQNGEWDNLVWRVSDEIANEVVDFFDSLSPEAEQVCYIANVYAITRDENET